MARKESIPDRYKNRHNEVIDPSAQPVTTDIHIVWPATNVTTPKAQLDGVTTAPQAMLDAQTALDTAVGLLNTAKGTALPVIRLDTKNPKATHGFTKGESKTLGVFATPETFEPNTYQPVLDATARHNYVEMMTKILGVYNLNLYWRSASTATWTLLMAKRMRFSFQDDTPAGQTMQAREYMAIGVVGDDEVGNPSNIASAVFYA